jgi:uncharacterized alkaline shock family protein YloU
MMFSEYKEDRMISIDLHDTTHGPRTEAVLSEAVVAAIAVRGATSVPGVLRTEPDLSGLVHSLVRLARQRSKGLEPAPTEGVRVIVEQDSAGASLVRVEIAVCVSGRRTASVVGQAVQVEVARAIAEATGLTPASVSVSILDIEVAGAGR